MDEKMQSRYIACLLLHAIGDTIGFNNGIYEFNFGIKHFTPNLTLEIVYDFIDKGGMNNINLENWRISDDTILHLKTAEALLEPYTSMNKLGNIIKNKYLEAYERLVKEYKIRAPGNATLKYLKLLKDGTEWDKIPYDLYAGGSGASMRCSCIGLVYYGKKNRDKLVQIAIESSRMTHNSAVGYLGGFTSALFTAFAIENIDIKKWPKKLIDIIGSKVGPYIDKMKRDVANFKKDVHVFLEKWTKYIDDKFDESGNVIKRRTTKNLVYRTKYYQDNFGFTGSLPGFGGDDSVIIAYDCLIDSGKSWDKLVYYSMLHAGDSDTTGCIAGSWFGAMIGLYNVPDNHFKYIEEKDSIIDLGKKLFELRD